MLVLCAAVGNPFVGSITRDQERPLEGLIFGLAIGLGVTATAILGAVAALGVRRWVLALTIVGLTAACRRQVPVVLARVAKVPGELQSSWPVTGRRDMRSVGCCWLPRSSSPSPWLRRAIGTR